MRGTRQSQQHQSQPPWWTNPVWIGAWATVGCVVVGSLCGVATFWIEAAASLKAETPSVVAALRSEVDSLKNALAAEREAVIQNRVADSESHALDVVTERQTQLFIAALPAPRIQPVSVASIAPPVDSTVSAETFPPPLPDTTENSGLTSESVLDTVWPTALTVAEARDGSVTISKGTEGWLFKLLDDGKIHYASVDMTQ
jgi:hypothetical protein